MFKRKHGIAKEKIFLMYLEMIAKFFFLESRFCFNIKPTLTPDSLTMNKSIIVHDFLRKREISISIGLVKAWLFLNLFAKCLINLF